MLRAGAVLGLVLVLGALTRREVAAAEIAVTGGGDWDRYWTLALLTASPDLAVQVRSVSFVPLGVLLVNTDPHHRHRCVPDCVAESDVAQRAIRIGLLPGWTTFHGDQAALARLLFHEAAHILLYARCGPCTEDEVLVERCARDPAYCHAHGRHG
jgi:hypothetical protein